MEAANTVSILVIAIGWLGATLWSGRRALRTSGWRRGVHGLNAVLMVVAGLAVMNGQVRAGMIAGVLLLLSTTLVARGDRSDPWRWLVMVQFIFALFVASGAPFRMIANG